MTYLKLFVYLSRNTEFCGRFSTVERIKAVMFLPHSLMVEISLVYRTVIEMQYSIV